MTDRLSIRRPDDWHLHLRDGDLLAAVLPATTAVMGRALVMPNLVPPVVTTAAAAAYRARIQALLPPGSGFEPLMAAYLTEDTDPVDIEQGFRDGVLFAVKLYPAGATTHSAAGVRSLSAVRRVLERLEAIRMPLLVHGEVTDPDVDIFDREAVFIDRHLGPLLEEHPGLRVVLEHVTTREGVDFVQAHGGRVGATVTPQHLLANRNDLLVGGVRPHLYCLPVLKRASHQRALREAVCSGDPSFFLGTDSAPHLVVHKESACGCAGCFTAPAALPLYAEVFEDEGALDRLEGFTSVNGPTFYGLPVSTERVTLVRDEGQVPHRVVVAGGGELRPFMAGRRLRWTVAARAADD